MDANRIAPRAGGSSTLYGTTVGTVRRLAAASFSSRLAQTTSRLAGMALRQMVARHVLTLWGLGTGALLMGQAIEATWGSLEPWKSCALVALVLGAAMGAMLSVGRAKSSATITQGWPTPPLGSILFATCVWFWIGPLWLSIPVKLLSWFSIETLGHSAGFIPVAMFIAMATVGLTSGLCVWSLKELCVLCEEAQSAPKADDSTASFSMGHTGWLACGLGLGMLLSVVLLAYGASPSILLGLAGLATGIPGVWRWMDLHPAEGLPTSHNLRSPVNSAFSTESRSLPILLILGTAALVAGTAFWGVERLVNDRIPSGSYMATALAVGWLMGWAAATSWTSRRRSQPGGIPVTSPRYPSHRWAMVWFGIAGMALNLLLLPAFTEALLRTNASVNWSPGVWAIRMVFASVMVWPAGWLFSCATSSAALVKVGSARNLLWGICFAAGWLGAQWLGRPLLAPIELLAASIWLLALMTIGPVLLALRGDVAATSAGEAQPASASSLKSVDSLLNGGRGAWALSARMGSLFAVVASLGLLAGLPWAIHRESPAWNARALFSTTAFVAWHAGFSSNMLTALDEGRVTSIEHAPNGTLVRWRYKFLEDVTRVNGIPLPPISQDPRVVPQSVPELILTTLPMVMHHEARSVLLLGVGSGLPLVTLADLPLQNITCLEGDQRNLALARAHVAPTLGAALDERFHIHNVDPAWGTASLAGRFDVVISAPSLTSTDRGIPFATREHYLRCAERLADDGIFCQRYECVDYGPQVLVDVARTLRSVFREVSLVQTGVPGEALWIATNSKQGLVREGLLSRTRSPQMRRILAQAGWDWSMMAGLSLVDDAALGELDGGPTQPHLRYARSNTVRSNHLAWLMPIETMRWDTKLQQTQALLSAARTTEPVYPPLPIPYDPESGEEPPAVAYRRTSLLMEGMGFDGEDPDLIRRLEEIVAQKHLIHDHPEAWWWEYRKTIKERLGKPPVASVRLATAQALKGGMLPDYARRKDYFQHLGEAIRSPNPAAEVEGVLRFEDTYDPLLSPFIHQEVAELLHKGGDSSAADELRHRLHLVYFAPSFDSSVRNVQQALELVLDHPETIVDDSARYDLVLSLLHVMRNRWNLRSSQTLKSVRLTLRDIDVCLITARRGKETLGQLADSGVSDPSDWKLREQGLDRLLLQPLETYRDTLRNAKPEFKEPTAKK